MPPFVPDDPVEVPSGRLVCRAHGHIICVRCGVDYSFMEDVLKENGNTEEYEPLTCVRHWRLNCPLCVGGEDSSEDEDDDSAEDVTHVETRSKPYQPGVPDRSTGRVFPNKFIPPTEDSHPENLFNEIAVFGKSYRWTRVVNGTDRQCLLFTDGACLDNGQPGAKAGWACVFGPSITTLSGNPHTTTTNSHVISGRLEQKGPYGDAGEQKSNRAELRAAVGALMFRHWVGEGFKSVVIATDSEYLVKGSTEWAPTWASRGWRNAKGGPLANRDLWQALLGAVEEFAGLGMEVYFWQIPRELNVVADREAKLAARGENRDRYAPIVGTMF